jgi:hypothetical protein
VLNTSLIYAHVADQYSGLIPHVCTAVRKQPFFRQLLARTFDCQVRIACFSSGCHRERRARGRQQSRA